MASGYPAAVDSAFTAGSPTATSPRNNPSLAGEIIDLNDAVVKIETELGTNPRGGFSDVKARIVSAESSITTISQSWIREYAKEGTLIVTTGKGRFRFPFAVTILGVSAVVDTAPTGAAIIIDVNKNGTTIFTTQGNRPQIAAGANNTASEVTNMNVTAFAAGDYMTVDIDQIGSTVAGADLMVFVRYQRP